MLEMGVCTIYLNIRTKYWTLTYVGVYIYISQLIITFEQELTLRDKMCFRFKYILTMIAILLLLIEKFGNVMFDFIYLNIAFKWSFNIFFIPSKFFQRINPIQAVKELVYQISVGDSKVKEKVPIERISTRISR